MLGAAWKWLGEEHVYCVSVKASDIFNDYGVTKNLTEALSKADVVVGHNSNRFDIKKLQTRMLKHRLPPIYLPNKKRVDTFSLVKSKFDIDHNDLSYCLKFCGLPVSKAAAPNWRLILEGDASELAYMRKYNKIDVIAGEGLYKHTRGWGDNHPDLRPILNVRDEAGAPVEVCRSCGHYDLREVDREYFVTGYKQVNQCQRCGGFTKTNIIKHKKPKSRN